MSLKIFNFKIILDTNPLKEKNIPNDYRLILTNYTMGSIGHPYDNRPTVFNQNFGGTSSEIVNTYCDFLDNLSYWDKFIRKAPTELVIIKTKHQNELFTNDLFSDLKFG